MDFGSTRSNQSVAWSFRFWGVILAESIASGSSLRYNSRGKTLMGTYDSC